MELRLTVYFVDEDYPKYQAWLEELRYRKRRVCPIGNADDAYAVLIAADDIELVIIDVMLSASPTGSSQFTRARTDDFLETGLALLEDLAAHRPEVFPQRAVLLTNTINRDTFRAARECAGRHKVILLEKSVIVSPFDFGDRIESLCEDAGS